LTTDDIGEANSYGSDRFGTLISHYPPPKNAVLSPDASRNPSIPGPPYADMVRMALAESHPLIQRSRIETQISRWKAVIESTQGAQL
jgi:hypothetical protein